ncbi:hypothetical protein BESB_072770 [Besnoitia besnoiti]|uniref:Uncharacterized protein n=1 Tax=Besnoitia besnoiti TaxID=94643 RepID=A0A2A9M811_BESBE|nr:uncharacterized protein BESB_072770 [Besnoitia besnoiti]PFH34125.1 hypothetical protein BESB_072770 [Besnoitia besnoiti]
MPQPSPLICALKSDSEFSEATPKTKMEPRRRKRKGGGRASWGAAPPHALPSAESHLKRGIGAASMAGRSQPTPASSARSSSFSPVCLESHGRAISPRQSSSRRCPRSTSAHASSLRPSSPASPATGGSQPRPVGRRGAGASARNEAASHPPFTSSAPAAPRCAATRRPFSQTRGSSGETAGRSSAAPLPRAPVLFSPPPVSASLASFSAPFRASAAPAPSSPRTRLPSPDADQRAPAGAERKPRGGARLGLLKAVAAGAARAHRAKLRTARCDAESPPVGASGDASPQAPPATELYVPLAASDGVSGLSVSCSSPCALPQAASPLASSGPSSALPAFCAAASSGEAEARANDPSELSGDGQGETGTLGQREEQPESLRKRASAAWPPGAVETRSPEEAERARRSASAQRELCDGSGADHHATRRRKRMASSRGDAEDAGNQAAREIAGECGPASEEARLADTEKQEVQRQTAADAGAPEEGRKTAEARQGRHTRDTREGGGAYRTRAEDFESEPRSCDSERCAVGGILNASVSAASGIRAEPGDREEAAGASPATERRGWGEEAKRHGARLAPGLEATAADTRETEARPGDEDASLDTQRRQREAVPASKAESARGGCSAEGANTQRRADSGHAEDMRCVDSPAQIESVLPDTEEEGPRMRIEAERPSASAAQTLPSGSPRFPANHPLSSSPSAVSPLPAHHSSLRPSSSDSSPFASDSAPSPLYLLPFSSFCATTANAAPARRSSVHPRPSPASHPSVAAVSLSSAPPRPLLPPAFPPAGASSLPASASPVRSPAWPLTSCPAARAAPCLRSRPASPPSSPCGDQPLPFSAWLASHHAKALFGGDDSASCFSPAPPRQSGKAAAPPVAVAAFESPPPAPDCGWTWAVRPRATSNPPAPHVTQSPCAAAAQLSPTCRQSDRATGESLQAATAAEAKGEQAAPRAPGTEESADGGDTLNGRVTEEAAGEEGTSGLTGGGETTWEGAGAADRDEEGLMKEYTQSEKAECETALANRNEAAHEENCCRVEEEECGEGLGLRADEEFEREGESAECLAQGKAVNELRGLLTGRSNRGDAGARQPSRALSGDCEGEREKGRQQEQNGHGGEVEPPKSSESAAPTDAEVCDADKTVNTRDLHRATQKRDARAGARVVIRQLPHPCRPAPVGSPRGCPTTGESEACQDPRTRDEAVAVTREARAVEECGPCKAIKVPLHASGCASAGASASSSCVVLSRSRAAPAWAAETGLCAEEGAETEARPEARQAQAYRGAPEGGSAEKDSREGEAADATQSRESEPASQACPVDSALSSQTPEEDAGGGERGPDEIDSRDRESGAECAGRLSAPVEAPSQAAERACLLAATDTQEGGDSEARREASTRTREVSATGEARGEAEDVLARTSRSAHSAKHPLAVEQEKCTGGEPREVVGDGEGCAREEREAAWSKPSDLGTRRDSALVPGGEEEAWRGEKTALVRELASLKEQNAALERDVARLRFELAARGASREIPEDTGPAETVPAPAETAPALAEADGVSQPRPPATRSGPSRLSDLQRDDAAASGDACGLPRGAAETQRAAVRRETLPEGVTARCLSLGPAESRAIAGASKCTCDVGIQTETSTPVVPAAQEVAGGVLPRPSASSPASSPASATAGRPCPRPRPPGPPPRGQKPSGPRALRAGLSASAASTPRVPARASLAADATPAALKAWGCCVDRKRLPSLATLAGRAAVGRDQEAARKRGGGNPILSGEAPPGCGADARGDSAVALPGEFTGHVAQAHDGAESVFWLARAGPLVTHLACLEALGRRGLSIVGDRSEARAGGAAYSDAERRRRRQDREQEASPSAPAAALCLAGPRSRSTEASGRFGANAEGASLELSRARNSGGNGFKRLPQKDAVVQDFLHALGPSIFAASGSPPPAVVAAAKQLRSLLRPSLPAGGKKQNTVDHACPQLAGSGLGPALAGSLRGAGPVGGVGLPDLAGAQTQAEARRGAADAKDGERTEAEEGADTPEDIIAQRKCSLSPALKKTIGIFLSAIRRAATDKSRFLEAFQEQLLSCSLKSAHIDLILDVIPDLGIEGSEKQALWREGEKALASSLEGVAAKLRRLGLAASLPLALPLSDEEKLVHIVFSFESLRRRVELLQFLSEKHLHPLLASYSARIRVKLEALQLLRAKAPALRLLFANLLATVDILNREEEANNPPEGEEAPHSCELDVADAGGGRENRGKKRLRGEEYPQQEADVMTRPAWFRWSVTLRKVEEGEKGSASLWVSPARTAAHDEQKTDQKIQSRGVFAADRRVSPLLRSLAAHSGRIFDAGELLLLKRAAEQPVENLLADVSGLVAALRGLAWAVRLLRKKKHPSEPADKVDFRAGADTADTQLPAARFEGQPTHTLTETGGETANTAQPQPSAAAGPGGSLGPGGGARSPEPALGSTPVPAWCVVHIAQKLETCLERQSLSWPEAPRPADAFLPHLEATLSALVTSHVEPLLSLSLELAYRYTLTALWMGDPDPFLPLAAPAKHPSSTASSASPSESAPALPLLLGEARAALCAALLPPLQASAASSAQSGTRQNLFALLLQFFETYHKAEESVACELLRHAQPEPPAGAPPLPLWRRRKRQESELTNGQGETGGRGCGGWKRGDPAGGEETPRRRMPTRFASPPKASGEGGEENGAAATQESTKPRSEETKALPGVSSSRDGDKPLLSASTPWSAAAKRLRSPAASPLALPQFSLSRPLPPHPMASAASGPLSFGVSSPLVKRIKVSSLGARTTPLFALRRSGAGRGKETRDSALAPPSPASGVAAEAVSSSAVGTSPLHERPLHGGRLRVGSLFPSAAAHAALSSAAATHGKKASDAEGRDSGTGGGDAEGAPCALEPGRGRAAESEAAGQLSDGARERGESERGAESAGEKEGDKDERSKDQERRGRVLAGAAEGFAGSHGENASSGAPAPPEAQKKADEYSAGLDGSAQRPEETHSRAMQSAAARRNKREGGDSEEAEEEASAPLRLPGRCAEKGGTQVESPLRVSPLAEPTHVLPPWADSIAELTMRRRRKEALEPRARFDLSKADTPSELLRREGSSQDVAQRRDNDENCDNGQSLVHAERQTPRVVLYPASPCAPSFGAGGKADDACRLRSPSFGLGATERVAAGRSPREIHEGSGQGWA